jgi:hypothetical protein
MKIFPNQTAGKQKIKGEITRCKRIEVKEYFD